MAIVNDSLSKAKFYSLGKESLSTDQTQKISSNLTLAIELIQLVFRSNKEKQLTQKKIQNNSPLVSVYRQLSENTNPILDGYGVYLVYQKKDTSNEPVSQELYNLVYEIINKPGPFPKSRSIYIREEIQKVDPNLDIIFIPRTLYELIYIEASIKEEMEKSELCELKKELTYDSMRKKHKETFLDTFKHCWHICHFTDFSLPDDDNSFLYFLAFRMNNLVLKKLLPIKPLTGSQITRLTEKKLKFFKNHQKIFPPLLYAKVIKSSDFYYGGTINFGLHNSNEITICYPMGIKDENDAQIIRNAVALECNKIAQNAFILYRAEKHLRWKEHKLPDPKTTSLSYGTSLFAGAFLDVGANVFYYTKQKKNRVTYAIIVPYLDEKSPFFIPKTHPIRQLFSKGEFFHARSLLSKEACRKFVKGIYLCSLEEKTIPDSLYSALNGDTLLTQLYEYYNTAILLTPFDRLET